jgi:putative acetyltransferase
MEIRAEKPEDVNAVRQVNVAAFKRENEADLVDRLRDVALIFSFVAVKSKPSRTSPKGFPKGYTFG